MVTSTTNQWQQNDIRNHTDFLEKAPGKDKYICPVCGGNDLSINQESLKLATLPSIPTDIPQPVNWIPILGFAWERVLKQISKIGNFEYRTEAFHSFQFIEYPYSDASKIRIQWVDKSKHKGRDQTFIWKHRNSETGKTIWRKPENLNPYRLHEVNEHSSGQFFLAVEGEKNIEACRSLGLVASDLTALNNSKHLLSLKEKDIGVIILPDKDQAGTDKADKLEDRMCMLQRRIITTP